MSVCRSGHGVGVVNGCLYALGGHDGVSYRNKVEFFEPQVGEWTTVGQMGMCKAVAGVAVMKEHWHLEHISVLQELERFSCDFEMKTREQNKNNKRSEVERFDWFIERIQTRVAFGWLSERSGEKT